jgi:hypothetical protein
VPTATAGREDSGDDPTSAAGPPDTSDVVVCPAYGEHPATLGWVPDVEVWFGRCAACGRPVPLDEDGLTTMHSW